MALYVASYIIGLSGKSIISEAGRESPQCLESLKSKPRHEAVYIKMPDISLAHEMRILGLGIIIVIANQKNKWIFVANESWSRSAVNMSGIQNGHASALQDELKVASAERGILSTGR